MHDANCQHVQFEQLTNEPDVAIGTPKEQSAMNCDEL